MPEATIHTITAAELKVGDLYEHGAKVTKLRILDVNVELTLESGTHKRLRKTAEVHVTRFVPTVEEQRQQIVNRLDTAVMQVKETIRQSAKTPDAIKAKIAESTNLLYTLHWDAEGWMVDLHRASLLDELGGYLDKDWEDAPRSDAEIIISWMEITRRRMLEWSPGRSTSVMSNLEDDAKFLAMKGLVTSSGYADGFTSVEYYVKHLAEFDAATPPTSDRVVCHNTINPTTTN